MWSRRSIRRTLFSYERGEREIEYSIGEYMDAEAMVHTAFDIEAPETA